MKGGLNSPFVLMKWMLAPPWSIPSLVQKLDSSSYALSAIKCILMLPLQLLALTLPFSCPPNPSFFSPPCCCFLDEIVPYAFCDKSLLLSVSLREELVVMIGHVSLMCDTFTLQTLWCQKMLFTLTDVCYANTASAVSMASVS